MTINESSVKLKSLERRTRHKIKGRCSAPLSAPPLVESSRADYDRPHSDSSAATMHPLGAL